MKKNVTKIWGIGLVLVLLTSMLLAAVPVSAGTLSFGATVIPTTTDNVLTNGTAITDIAVSADGLTIWAAVGSSTLYKSLDGGLKWTTKTVTGDADLVSIAPDDANIVAYAKLDATAAVYVTTNGGATAFATLGTVQESDGTAANTLTDLDISPASGTTHYVGVSGYETSGGGAANVWYFNVGAAAPAWKETNDKAGWATNHETFVGSSEDISHAIAWSPSFPSDKVLVAVTSNTSVDVSLQMFSLASGNSKWNTAAGFASFPAVISNDTTAIDDATVAASLALAPDYLGSDSAMRIAFIGIREGTAATSSGIYRVKNTTEKNLKASVNVHSIDYNGTDLVAGRYDSNTVYRCADPLVTSPTVSGSSSLKSPGMASSANEQVVVAWKGDDSTDQVVAGMQGDESAFSISRDKGKSWNGISLIDTALTTLNDFAVSADGEQYYLATDDGTNANLFRYKATANAGSPNWERVFVVASKTDFLTRIAPDDADVIYLANQGTTVLYYSTDAGEAKWFTRTAGGNIQDLAVEEGDGSVSYASTSSAATVRMSSNGGFTWGGAKATLLAAGNVHSITSVSEGNVVVGGTTGYVAYSTDSGSTWTSVPKQVESSGLLTQVVAEGLATDDYIYASTSKAAGTTLRWKVGQADTTPWKGIQGTSAASYGSYGLALVDGTIYNCSTDGSDSKLIRNMSPTSDNPSTSHWSTLASAGETFNRAPSALRTSSGNKIWFIDSTDPSIFSFTDTLTTAGPTLVSPADGTLVDVNPVTGKAYDQALTWDRLSKATGYQINVALDSAFKEKFGTITTASTTSTSDPRSEIVGPNGTTTNASINFDPDTTYYWRVRASVSEKADTIYSPFSEVRSFTVGNLAESVAALTPAAAVPAPSPLSPANGASGIGLSPAYSWTPISGTATYEFQLAAAPFAKSWAAALASASIAEPSVRPVIKLDQDRTYFWRVRADGGEWSVISNFTTEKAPPPAPKPPAPAPPPVVVQEAAPVPAPIINLPAPVVNLPPAAPLPAPITPAYIWSIIIIGAVLVIAVIVLIVRTRRPV